jgi:hypothetical protein
VPNIISALAWIAAPIRGASAREVAPRQQRSAERGGVEMHALEMQGCFVLLGIANRAKGVLGFERDAPQRLAAKGHGGVCEVAPVCVGAVMQTSSVVERETHAFERSETVGELVLDSLKFSDWLAELMTLLGIVHGEFESAPRCAMRPRQEGQPALEQEIIGRDTPQRNEVRRRGVEAKLIEPGGAHGAARLGRNAGRA